MNQSVSKVHEHLEVECVMPRHTMHYSTESIESADVRFVIGIWTVAIASDSANSGKRRLDSED